MGRIRPGGGYRELRSFQMATVIYDATWRFCEQYLDARSRICDRMTQAARSGRQNIAEGSRASSASSQTELRLVNVARSSLEELLLDYEDYLRHRGLPQWAYDSPEAMEVRKVRAENQSDKADQFNRTEQSATRNSDDKHYSRYKRWLEHAEPSIRANAIICLIHQAIWLLDRKIEALEREFIEDGGYSGQLSAARLAERNRKKQDMSDQSDPPPLCPKCGKTMVLRTVRKGNSAGRQFFGCTGYPECNGSVEV
ncbi:MAG: four helix bundle protein [Chlorobiaceae bacterium]|nr:four helix bundle protein [Chlorobiaceae bacterium]